MHRLSEKSRTAGKKVIGYGIFFRQLKGLGRSYTSDFYGIVDLDEAKAFLQDPYLGKHLQKISEALLNLDNDNATQIMGRPDDMKLKSSMTLFACADPENAVFEKVLEKFYNGHKDGRTLKMLSKENG